MSAFREYLESLGRILGRPVAVRGDLVHDEAPRLAASGGRGLLHWEDAVSIPYERRGDDRRRGRVDGEFFGTPFTVWFPAMEAQPPGHVWVLACWRPERSGTHRAEVLAACRTCSDAALAAGGPGTTVGPASCVVRASQAPGD